MSQLHADVVFLFLGLTVGPGPGAAGRRAPTPATLRAAYLLVGLQLAQGLVGFVQYFTDLPVVLVGLHMLGAALISAAVAWVLVQSREDPALG